MKKLFRVAGVKSTEWFIVCADSYEDAERLFKERTHVKIVGSIKIIGCSLPNETDDMFFEGID